MFSLWSHSQKKWNNYPQVFHFKLKSWGLLLFFEKGIKVAIHSEIKPPLLIKKKILNASFVTNSLTTIKTIGNIWKFILKNGKKNQFASKNPLCKIFFFNSLPVFKFRDVKINPDLKGQPIRKQDFEIWIYFYPLTGWGKLMTIL